MSEQHGTYNVKGTGTINPRALLRYDDPNYEPPTFEDVQALRTITGKSATELGKITGTDNRGFRRWTAPAEKSGSKMPYSAWRLLLIEFGLTDGMRATTQIKFTRLVPHHEHPDCIRIAFEWLSAQTLIEKPNGKKRALKHLIENWGGRYVSTSDVEVAATMLPGLYGEYPCYNISSRLVEPSQSRLEGVGEAHTHSKHDHHDPSVYSRQE